MHMLHGIADIIEDSVFNRDVPFDVGAACRCRVLEIISDVAAERLGFDEARGLAMDQLRITLKSLPPEPYVPAPYPVFQDRRHAPAI